MDSVKNNYSIGMRFKMRFEGEEAPEQRYGLCLPFFVMTWYPCMATSTQSFMKFLVCYYIRVRNSNLICEQAEIMFFNFFYCRFTGTIVGIEDADSKRWQDSKWRCLKVDFI